MKAFAEAAGMAEAPPSLRIGAGRQGARLSADPRRAARLMENAVRLLPTAAPYQLGRSDQQHLIGEFAGLAADAAALALADPGAPAGERAARALRLLETGRAVRSAGPCSPAAT
ncbi:hypothetical protein Acor_49800 [Acrocarpospora corrugata]|uniref:Uncharacterized protein n=1 Tax=Acrocarpospora corrugata TaxID=35763 RepID=A0A5M3W2E5_9ACTN|nr:hypothetical protein [Acrocarpospora corrugata]GES02914.1 hypothetical protein Acor_49800 [Acrocarpospora corrugata]